MMAMSTGAKVRCVTATVDASSIRVSFGWSGRAGWLRAGADWRPGRGANCAKQDFWRALPCCSDPAKSITGLSLAQCLNRCRRWVRRREQAASSAPGPFRRQGARKPGGELPATGYALSDQRELGDLTGGKTRLSGRSGISTGAANAATMCLQQETLRGAGYSGRVMMINLLCFAFFLVAAVTMAADKNIYSFTLSSIDG